MNDSPKKTPTPDELDQLSRELAQRSGRKEDLVLRLTLWKFTVRLTYALKRVLDILLAGLALIFLLPLMTLIALTIKLTSRGPVFLCRSEWGVSAGISAFINSGPCIWMRSNAKTNC